jgi:hypothetical protein
LNFWSVVVLQVPLYIRHSVLQMLQNILQSVFLYTAVLIVHEKF